MWKDDMRRALLYEKYRHYLLYIPHVYYSYLWLECEVPVLVFIEQVRDIL